jgi:hypothetical protein
MQHFFDQKGTLFARELKLLTILFSPLLSVHLPFAKPIPVISARGIKRPCYLSEKTMLLL